MKNCRRRDCQGGLAGINYKCIEDSYAVGFCRGGGVCGINKGELIHCYGQYKGARICAKQEGRQKDCFAGSELPDLDLISQWNFGTLWSPNTKGWPVFQQDNWLFQIREKIHYLEIDSIQDLQYFMQRLQAEDQVAQNTNLLLTCDLDWHHRRIHPMGTAGFPYKGIFNGNGHKISNFRIKEDKLGSVGFFGCLFSATVMNLTVEGTVTGGSNTGLLCGTNILSGILCCGAIGEVQGYENTGGLCGKNNGLIRQCNFYGYVKETGQKTAVGILTASLLVESCLLVCLLIQSTKREPEFVFLPEEVDAGVQTVQEKITMEPVSMETNSITMKVQQKVVYYQEETEVAFELINPDSSNQIAVAQLLYTSGEDYKEDGDYVVIAQSGAIPPGYQVERIAWKGLAEEMGDSEALLPGTYEIYARISFYNALTNEKAMIDSVFQIELDVIADVE